MVVGDGEDAGGRWWIEGDGVEWRELSGSRSERGTK